MPIAEIITIGTEILLGEIVDTNTRYLARELRDHGIDIYRTSSVGDNAERIATIVQETLRRAQVVITTGGLGPTIDDPTREAIARAFGVELEYHEELWQQVIERFSRFNRVPGENNRRQAFIPAGAVAIENAVGTAPAFMMETPEGVVISLPGVPREMEHLLSHAVLPYLQGRFKLDTVIRVRVLHASGAGESQIDEKVADLELLTNPTVGLAAHSGRVDVRITAKAHNEAEAFRLIQEVEQEVRARLGDWIYGADGDPLAQVGLERLHQSGSTLAVLEAGLDGKLLQELSGPLTKHPEFASTILSGAFLPTPPADPAELLDLVKELRTRCHADIGLGATAYLGEKVSEIYLAVVTPTEEKQLRIPYGGPPKLAQPRAINNALDLLRRTV